MLAAHLRPCCCYSFCLSALFTPKLAYAAAVCTSHAIRFWLASPLLLSPPVSDGDGSRLRSTWTRKSASTLRCATSTFSPRPPACQQPSPYLYPRRYRCVSQNCSNCGVVVSSHLRPLQASSTQSVTWALSSTTWLLRSRKKSKKQLLFEPAVASSNCLLLASPCVCGEGVWSVSKLIRKRHELSPQHIL